MRGNPESDTAIRGNGGHLDFVRSHCVDHASHALFAATLCPDERSKIHHDTFAFSILHLLFSDPFLREPKTTNVSLGAERSSLDSRRPRVRISVSLQLTSLHAELLAMTRRPAQLPRLYQASALRLARYYRLRYCWHSAPRNVNPQPRRKPIYRSGANGWVGNDPPETSSHVFFPLLLVIISIFLAASGLWNRAATAGTAKEWAGLAKGNEQTASARWDEPTTQARAGGDRAIPHL